jgi:hypothetical protein
MRKFLSALVAISFLSSSSIADPLPAGKPAGVRHAVSETEELTVIAIGTLAVIGLCVGIFEFGKSAPSTTGTAT